MAAGWGAPCHVLGSSFKKELPGVQQGIPPAAAQTARALPLPAHSKALTAPMAAWTTRTVGTLSCLALGSFLEKDMPGGRQGSPHPCAGLAPMAWDDVPKAARHGGKWGAFLGAKPLSKLIQGVA